MKTFFDEENRKARMQELGDPLQHIHEAVDFGIFKPLLEEIFVSHDNRAGGRQRWDRLLMFKIMILRELYHLSDEQTEYQINDRISFQNFLGLELGDRVPDAKTIWKYREELKESGREKELFSLYTKELTQAGLVTRDGSIVDATVMRRPQQRAHKKSTGRFGKEEKPKEGCNFSELRQLDKDARYTVKHGKRYFGYKNHVKADRESKIITDYALTPANVHDNNKIAELVDEKDKELYADSAYSGKNIAEKIHEKNPRVKLHISEQGRRYHPLTDEQKKQNKTKATIRARVEHIFGHMEKSMGGKFLRCVGVRRAETEVMLKNLAYNMYRSALLMRT